jgi:hypothetical protein
MDRRPRAPRLKNDWGFVTVEPEDEGCLTVMALWDEESVDEDEQWPAVCAWLADEWTQPCYGVEHPGAAALHLQMARSHAFSAKPSSAVLFSRDEPARL